MMKQPLRADILKCAEKYDLDTVLEYYMNNALVITTMDELEKEVFSKQNMLRQRV